MIETTSLSLQMVQMYSSSFDKFHVIIVYCKDIYGHYCIKETLITSTHYFP